MENRVERYITKENLPENFNPLWQYVSKLDGERLTRSYETYQEARFFLMEERRIDKRNREDGMDLLLSYNLRRDQWERAHQTRHQIQRVVEALNAGGYNAAPTPLIQRPLHIENLTLTQVPLNNGPCTEARPCGICHQCIPF